MRDVRVMWEGKEYLIPSQGILSLIVKVEDVITLMELEAYALRGTLPQAKIARAYALVLNYAGCEVDETTVYYSMFPADGGKNIQKATEIVQGLMAMMMPPEHMRQELAKSGNSKAPVRSGASSRKRTKRG